MHHEKVQLQKSLAVDDCHVIDDKKSGATPHSSGKSSPVSQAVLTPHGKSNVENSCLECSAGQSGSSVDEIRNREVPTDSCCDLTTSIHLAGAKAIQQKPSPAPRRHWKPIPKHQERTLKLVAINPSQLVKRPAGIQPVVVLNHPDADIPQVAKIMEVVHRYREVRKVVLSRRTLNALGALNGELADTNDPTDLQTEPARRRETSVQERFTLKLKLRRLSRKKYEIVEAVCPSREFVSKFPCWFCGRIFTSQETMLAHRQRHLMEWRRPKCENS
ncbi:zinc finger protein 518A [Xenentodon cancila]